MNRGNIVIVMMLVVGVGLASFAWWHRWRRGEQVLSNWGSDATVTIRLGEHVELWRLAEPTGTVADSDSERIAIGDQKRQITDRLDISMARGLIHARHVLVQREGFVWDDYDPSCIPSWGYVLRFQKGTSVASMALDFHCQRVRLLERNREAGMEPIAAGLRTFVEELMPMVADVDPKGQHKTPE